MSSSSFIQCLKQLVAKLEDLQQAIPQPSGPFYPAEVPIEGGTRIKLSGAGFVAGTTVTVATATASDLWISAPGDAVFFTTPTMPEGSVDVVLSIPNQSGQTYSSALSYVSSLSATARALVMSYRVTLGELIDRATVLANSGSLIGMDQVELRLRREYAMESTNQLMAARAAALDVDLDDPAASQAWQDAFESLKLLADEALTVIG